MSPAELEPYLVPAAFAAFVLWRIASFMRVKRALGGYLARGAVIVDVRSPAEFASGHVPGSVNIPLDRLGEAGATLDKAKPILVCCASGTRSAMAASALRRQGFLEVVNAGPWRNAIQDRG